LKVFITWSGKRSGEVGESIRQWLPGVLQAVKPYFSPDDVDKGSRWFPEISKELEASKVGLLCVTQDNLKSPWLLFEAGALSKNLDKSKVCPLLFGVNPTDLTGPLAQFQATRFKKKDFKKVISMINGEISNGALESNVLDEVFEMWWPRLEKEVTNRLESSGEDEEEQTRSDRDLLEEILTLNRNITRDIRTNTKRYLQQPLGLLSGLRPARTLEEALNISNDPSPRDKSAILTALLDVHNKMEEEKKKAIENNNKDDNEKDDDQ